MPLTLLLVIVATSQDPSPVAEVRVLSFDRQQATVTVGVDQRRPIQAGSSLLVAVADQPAGRFDLVDAAPGRAIFRRLRAIELDTGQRPRAWLVPPDLTARLLDSWPEDCPLLSTVESALLTPEGWRAWVRAGTSQGITAGMFWLHRTGEQPTFRLETRSVRPDLCYCAAVPLAEGAELAAGDRVELWPSPGKRRIGSGETAVCYLDASTGTPTLWLPAPPEVAAPPECVLEFWRGRQYLGHGIVEARDELFWYARLVAVASSTGTPAGQPATYPACPLRVGDRAAIRTQADIESRRFTPRIFEIAGDRAVINAGEMDGLRPDQIADLYRGNVRIGAVRIARVQRGYSVISPANPGESPAWQTGDEIRFRPPTSTLPVARIEEIVDETLFSARLLADLPATTERRSLAVYSSEQPVGVAMLLTQDDRSAVGLAIEESLVRPLRRGDVLMLERPAAAANQPRKKGD